MQGQERLLEITSFSARGDGIASLPSGRAVEIPHAYPGDFLIARERGRKTPPFIESIWQEAASRTPAPCPHFGSCGGCLWQGMALGAQAAAKEAKIARLFPGALILPLVQAEVAWHYRARMEFTFAERRDGSRALGLYAAHRQRVTDLESCMIGPRWTKELLRGVRAWWESSKLSAYQPRRDVGLLRTLTARSSLRTGARMVILTVNAKEELPTEALASWIAAVREALGDDKLSLYLQRHVAEKGSATQFELVHLLGPERLKEELHVGGRLLEFELSPTSFFQPHPLQAERLIEQLQKLCQLERGARLLDLYCGVGGIGLGLVPEGGKLMGIERHEGAIQGARRAAEKLSGIHTEFFVGDATELSSQLKERLTGLDLLIVDPPRAGLGAPLVGCVAELRPKAVAYVACNPVTQAKEVQALCEQGFKLKSIHPVDLFPHTPHCENIAFLSLA